MITQYVVFDVSGRILRYGNCVDTDMQHQAYLPGTYVMEGTCDDLTDYVLGGSIIPRPASTVMLEGTTLKNVPVPAVVVIDGTRYDTDEADITLDLPIGKYKVRVEAFPYLDFETEVVV